MVAVTGATEVTVHGWDISVAYGPPAGPADLPAVLLPIAPLLITPGTRPGLFAHPVRLPGPASLGDPARRLPRLPAAARGRDRPGGG
jgi:hypothetical protein